MKKETRFVLPALLLAAALFIFAGEAAAKPDWVTVKYTGTALRRQQNSRDTSGNYLLLVHKFDIINSSKNGDILTAIYDRKISWAGKFTITDIDMDDDEEEDDSADPVTWNVKFSINGTNPIKGEWYPGQVYKYEQTTPLSRLIRPYEDDWKLTNRAAFKNFNFKFEKLSFDFQVASHR
jgi:hypothetical protein